MGVRLGLIGAQLRRHVSGLLEHRIPIPHRPPHHRVVIPAIFDESCGVETPLMLHLHGAEVGRYVVFESSGASDNWGVVYYAAHLRTARPPRPPLPSSSPASASSPSPSSHRHFFLPRCDGSVRLNEGVLTWSFKAPQVMGGWFDKRSLARIPELPEDVGDVRDDEATRRGL